MWEVIGKLVAALGGASVITIALTTFFGKLWADIFLKKKAAEYEKLVSEELERLRACNTRLNYIFTNLFDEEIKVAKELSRFQVGLDEDILKLCHLHIGICCTEDKVLERMENVINSLSKYRKALDENRLFMDDSLYDAAIQYYNNGICCYNIYGTNWKEVTADESRAQLRGHLEKSRNLRELIKKHLVARNTYSNHV